MFKFTEEDLIQLPLATYKDIHSEVNSYDMFRHYIGNFELGSYFLSPIRDEATPSFSVFLSGNSNKVIFKDYILGSGDIIDFVKFKFHLNNREAINKIIQDSGLNHKFRSDLNYTPKPVIKHDIILKNKHTVFRVKGRKWTDRDLQFWSSFHINKATLRKFKIIPISYLFANDIIIKTDNYTYAFRENKDGIASYTIYQPYSKNYKWRKSHDSSVFYGWTQLPERGDKLIITKSLKDIMTIDSITRIPASSLQGEGVKPKLHIINQLKERFTDIYLLYDNDYNREVNYGREFGKAIAEEFDLKQIEIPKFFAESYNAKDISDLAKNAGEEYVKTMLLTDINNYII